MKSPLHSLALILAVAWMVPRLLAGDPRPKEPAVDERLNAAAAFDPPPTVAEILKAIDASNDSRLLTELRRAKDGLGNAWEHVLRYHSPATLREGPHYLCLFTPATESSHSNNPRVVVLLDRDLKVVTYTRAACEPFFGYATIVTRTRNNETHLITVNRVVRWNGELWFERYKIEAAGITKLGEGYDSMMPKSDAPSR